MDIYNLKQVIRQKIWVTVLCAIILALCLSWASYLFVKTYAAVSVHSQSTYVYIGRDGVFSAKTPNTYYFVHDIKLKQMTGSPIKSDVFMQGSDTEYYGNYLDGFSKRGQKLSLSECAVSVDFAKKYGLEEGDAFVVRPFSGEDYEVTVKRILPEYFGLKQGEVRVNDSKGAVVLGYNKIIAQDTKGYRVYRFTDNSQNAFFGSTDAITHKSEVLSDLKVNYFIAAGISVFAVLFAVALMDGIFGGDERQDCRIFYGETANRRSQIIYIAVYSLYKHLFPFGIAIAAGCILTAILNAVRHVVFGYKIITFLIVFGVILLLLSTALSILINFLYARFKR